MPWSASDATHHTKKANTPAKRRMWAAVANSELKATGNEGRAVRAANSVVGKRKKKKKKTS